MYSTMRTHINCRYSGLLLRFITAGLATWIFTPIALAQTDDRAGASTTSSKFLGTNGAFLCQLDPATGTSTVISGVGLAGFAEVATLAFDPNTGTFFAEDYFTRQIIRIDPATRTVSVIGPGSWFADLAFDPNSNTLYGTLGLYLFTIDTATGVGTQVGQEGIDSEDVIGLAFDRNTNTLFALNRYRWLIAIDPTTGAGTRVGQIDLGQGCFDSLAFDPNTNTLYTRGCNNQLVGIDPAAATASTLGTLGFFSVFSLAFDPNTNTLFGVDARTDQIITIDPVTLVSTIVMPLGLGPILS